MTNSNVTGFLLKSAQAFLLCFFLVISSCEQREVAPKETHDKSLDKHYKFLMESSGATMDEIVYDKANDRFIIENHMLISKEEVEKYMLKSTNNVSQPNQKTQQRRHDFLLSDAYATNLKYTIPSNIPAAWRTAIQQAMAQWNAVGGSKLRISEVASGGHLTVTISYDAINNWVARASLPLSNGAPGGIFEINSHANNMEAGQKLFAMVHEMGHNIGFWHTNQEHGSVIPGTPVADPKSVMNSVVLPWEGFTEYDKIAVRTLYPGVVVTGVAGVYADCNFAGAAVGLTVGDYDLSAMTARGIGNDWISSINVTSGYRVTLYENAGFSGASLVLTAANSCLVGAGWNDRASSMRVSANTGAGIVSGATYSIINVHSGKAIEVGGFSTVNGGNVQQWDYVGAASQKWRVTDVGGGIFSMVNINSGRGLDVSGVSSADGANIYQWAYVGGNHQKWHIVANGDGTYRILAGHSGKACEVGGFSTANGGNVQQWTWANANSQKWRFTQVQ